MVPSPASCRSFARRHASDARSLSLRLSQLRRNFHDPSVKMLTTCKLPSRTARSPRACLAMYRTLSSPVHSERPEESAVPAEASRTIAETSLVPMRSIAAAEPSAPFAVTDPSE